MIKFIIFDLWQTLAYKDVECRAVSKMLKETKSKIPLKKFIKIFENSIQTKRWNSESTAYRNLCKNMGLEITKDNIRLLIDIRDEAESKTKLYNHTIPMLKKLRENGYKIGLISNTSIFSIKYIKMTGLLKYIDYPIFSFNVGVIKPNLKIFKKILKIRKFNPKESIMIGDKIEDDIIPPKRIGMNAIHFKNYKQLKKDLQRFGINIS